MRHKSTAKDPLCQDPKQTSEQKVIKRLKKLLAKEKATEMTYFKWWQESHAQVEQYKKKWQDSVQQANLLYTISQACQTQLDTLFSMNEIANGDALRWKEKYEQLVATSSESASGSPKNNGPSPCDGCDRKAFCNVWRDLGGFNASFCPLLPDEKIKRIKQTGFDDGGFTQRMEHFLMDWDRALYGEPEKFDKEYSYTEFADLAFDPSTEENLALQYQEILQAARSSSINAGGNLRKMYFVINSKTLQAKAL